MTSPSYSSSNSSVASVNGSTGQVRCLAGGTATINAVMNFTDYYWTGLYEGNECVAELFQTKTRPGGGMTVQVPTSLSIVSGTSPTTAEAGCQSGTRCGITRSFTYQVNDQNGSPIRVAGMEVWDSIATTTPNNLGLTSYVTTCGPGQTNSGPCGVTTNANGQFVEAALSVCSTVCFVNNACTTGGPTNATQTVHVAGATITQNIIYYCDHVTVNGN